MRFRNYVLKNEAGTEIHVTNFGGIIMKIITRDKNGKSGDITLGFDRAEDYERHPEHPYFGALIGRYGNRIARGRFTLDGTEYKLAVNNGPNHLHGGIIGFDKVFWESKQEGNKITLEYLSRDGEEGYPGNLKVQVTYELTEENELKIEYSAETDKATVINLTQHTYFNLSASADQTVLDQQITIHGEQFTEVDPDLTPTGRLIDVIGTDFDFRTPKKIGKSGYDHNWVLSGKSGEMKLAATLYDVATGRYMEVHTTEPGIQFYTGNFLDGKLAGKGGHAYRINEGLCLETQHFPDSPNHANFPSTVLRPGNKYKSATHYKFGVK